MEWQQTAIISLNLSLWGTVWDSQNLAPLNRLSPVPPLPEDAISSDPRPGGDAVDVLDLWTRYHLSTCHKYHNSRAKRLHMASAFGKTSEASPE
jgi:hypothetical protein